MTQCYALHVFLYSYINFQRDTSINANDLAQKQMIFNSLTIHYIIMTTCVSYENIFTASLPKYTNIAIFQTCVIRATVPIRYCGIAVGLVLKCRRDGQFIKT